MEETKLDKLIREDVEHGTFHAQNIFNEDYLKPQFYIYAKKIESMLEKLKDCSNCKHWSYSNRLLAYVCDCTDKIEVSQDSRTYESCENWECNYE